MSFDLVQIIDFTGSAERLSGSESSSFGENRFKYKVG